MSNDEPEKPRKRRWLKVVIGLCLVFVLVLAGIGSAILYRNELALALLHDSLKDAGLEETRFHIEHVTPNRVTIVGFSAGTALSFDRLVVKFSPGEIIKGRVDSVELTGLKIDMTQPVPWTRIRNKASGDGSTGTGPAFDLSVLPIISVQQAELKVPSPTGPVAVAASISLRPDQNGTLLANVTATTKGAPGTADLTYVGVLTVDDNGSAQAAGTLTAQVEDLTAGGAILKSLRLDLPVTIATQNGKTTISGRLKAAAAAVSLEKIALKSATLDLPLDIGLSGDKATADFTKTARFKADQILLDKNSGTGSVTASFTGQLNASRSDDGALSANGTFDLKTEKIRVGDISAGTFSTTLGTQIKAVRETIILDLDRGGQMGLTDLRLAGKTALASLSTLLSGNITLSRSKDGGTADANAGLAISHNLSLGPEPLTLHGTPKTQAILGTIDSSGSFAANGAYKGRLTIADGVLTHDSRSVAVSGVSVNLETRADLAAPSARIEIASLADKSAATVGGAPLGGDYNLAATVRQTRKGLVYRAELGGLGIKKLASVTGTHDLKGQSGKARVSIPDIALGPDGLEPVSIIPSLDKIRNISGKIGGTASLNWRPRKFNGRATLRLSALGAETDDGKIDDINGTIKLNSLVPLSTGPEQTLRIGTMEAGAVLTDTSIRFTVLPTGILRIGRAEATLADGKISLVAPAIDPVAETANVTVTLQGVQLAKLLKLINLGNVQASGQLHGVIPVRIDKGKIAIDSGALAALGGGFLQFKSEEAKQVLQGGGDQVALMLQALEDFTYEKLGVDIQKSLAGNTQVTLRTLGHNPAVLKGRKFQINVNLETNFDKLLEAALQWYRLSGRALRDIVAPEKR